jgi:hypothetical protein
MDLKELRNGNFERELRTEARVPILKKIEDTL